MADPHADDLSPTDKDPAEGGAANGDAGPTPTRDPAESHLGEGGDPAEG